MEALLGILILVIFVVLLVRAFRTKNPEEALRRDIQAATDQAAKSIGITAKSVGKAAAAMQNTAAEAKQAYSERRSESTGSTSTLNSRVEKYELIAKLKTLLDAGAISQEEFEAEKRKLLD